jgi:putative tryptophan/tyrosine transport system substrate-binding protein
MRRREFVTLLGGAAAWPLTAGAQQPVIYRIGVLSFSRADPGPFPRIFSEALSDFGYVAGRDVVFEFRAAEGEFDRLSGLAAELVALKVDLIVTPGSLAAARAAKAATATIPIVFGIGGDPVKLGLVASLNRPGGNLTGFVELNSEIASKQLGLLHDLVPRASRFAMLIDSNTSSTLVFAELQRVASVIGLQVEPLIIVGTDQDIDAAFASLAQKKVDALMVSPSPMFYTRRGQLAALATRHAVPTIYWDRAFAEAGGLMTYGSSVAEMFRQVGIYAGRIFKGEKPADMPVMQATKFELVINLKSAKELGLTIPETFLARVDEVIE